MNVQFKADDGKWYEITPSMKLHNTVRTSTMPEVIEEADPDYPGSELDYQGLELDPGNGIDIVSKVSSTSVETTTIVVAGKVRTAIMESVRPLTPGQNNRLFGSNRIVPVNLTDSDLSKVLNYVMTGKFEDMDKETDNDSE